MKYLTHLFVLLYREIFIQNFSTCLKPLFFASTVAKRNAGVSLPYPRDLNPQDLNFFQSAIFLVHEKFPRRTRREKSRTERSSRLDIVPAKARFSGEFAWFECLQALRSRESYTICPVNADASCTFCLFVFVCFSF